jgi:NADH dehydrogenase FAD-containing subunit
LWVVVGLNFPVFWVYIWGDAKAKIKPVDQNLTYFWKPLLHEIAVGALNSQI